MKKVLVISSSPRRNGNSDLLCDQFMKGAIEAGHRAEKIFLADKTIHYCTGCGACANATRPCVQKDDVAEILEKMVGADVIVLATPVYFYTMCAQLKTLIDRSCPRYTAISNKEFYFILTAADTSRAAMNRTLESLRGFTEDCLENSREKGIVFGLGVMDRGEVKETPAYREAFEMGKRI
ncbi:flavodoxin family protein [uncultured Victivallis sp.]|uniref:flavodoxin family protein n=1 Tax=uncultured Victivallis sp. TaxID=354118 RepID=UPI0025E71BBE|nr:flavodoxin family protein [uncultured Victivallis sp.]